MGAVDVENARAGWRRAPALLAFAVTVLLAASLSLVGAPAAAAEDPSWIPAVGGSFVASDPVRVLDTRRTGEGPCVSGERKVPMPTVPAEAGAVVLNVTVQAASSPGYVTLYAAGSARPGTSSLNYGRSVTIENSVTTAVGAEGVAVFASGGCPHVVVDLVGHYVGGKPARGGAFGSLTPSRPVDTRRAGEGPCVKGERVVELSGVPAGSGAVVANVTVTGASSPGFLSVYPAGSPRPATSTLNFVAGAAAANSVTTAVGPDGLALYASGGCPHVVVDVVGHFTGDGPLLEGSFAGSAGSRLVDTRRDGDRTCVKGERSVPLSGVPSGSAGVVLNVTVTGASAPGYVTVFADGAARPATSTLNFTKGLTTSNGTVVAAGGGGVRVFASGGCPHVIVDLLGHYSGEPAPLTGVAQVAAGMYHSCAVIDDGTVRCWGGDMSSDAAGGQLGDGRFESSAFPIPVSGIDDAVFVDVDWGTSCAVHGDASVSCWGWDLFGPSYWGTTIPPTKIDGLTGAESVAVAEVHACAQKSDGTVWCWGNPSFLGEPGGSTTTGPVQVPGVADVVEIAVGDFHTCARTDAGDVSCWGLYYEEGEPGESVTLDDVVGMDAAETGSCAVKADGAVWCWGEFHRMVDGVGRSTWADPVEVPALAGAVDVGMGVDGDVCALGADGAVRCLQWHPDVAGDVRTIAETGEAVALSVGRFSGCVRTNGSTARCWGGNVSGQLGNGSVDDSADRAMGVIRGIVP